MFNLQSITLEAVQIDQNQIIMKFVARKNNEKQEIVLS